MKLILIFVLTISSSFCTIAQNSAVTTLKELTGIIQGRVIDSKTKQPLPYVNIVIKYENKVVNGGITSENGTFLIKNLSLKNYAVEIQFIGYKTIFKSVNLTAEDKNFNLNTLSLEENAFQLEGVEVVREKSIIEQKIDRKIINVGKDLLSSGATAGEILNNIPSVSVDPQTNEISLRGNSNVRILIDGKPTTIEASQLLQQIPSASIKQIELITNPSAKYNPEGMSGIINIVLNKNSKIGFNGSVTNGVTFGITPKLNSSFDMNYRSGKFNIYANYGVNIGNQANRGFVNTTEIGETDSQLLRFANHSNSHLAKIGFDYYLNDKNTISFYTNQNIFNGKGVSKTTVDFFKDYNLNIEDKDVTGVLDVIQLFDNKKDNYNQIYNFDYKTNFKKEGHNLELEVNYNKQNNKENALFNETIKNNQTYNYITNNGSNTLINLDYVNPLTETAKMELGLESRIENTKNNFLLNNAFNSSFEYERNIYSAYSTFTKQLGKFSFQAGTRFEKYNAKAGFIKISENDSNIEDNFFTLYPSGYLNYSPSDKNTFNLSTSRRVDRPSLEQLNPIREWSTPQIDSEGNPELVPQFTNSVEFNYTRKTKIGSITTGVFYRRIYKEITRVLFKSPTNTEKLILTYDNLVDNNAYGFEVSGNLQFTKWFSSNISADVYSKKANGVVGDESLSIDVTVFNTRINNTFKINKNLRLQLSGMYRGRDLRLQFVREPMWKMDMGASQNILKGDGTITFRFSDIFNSFHFAFDGDKPIRRNGQFNWESQTAYIGFNYRFGSGKNKSIQRKERDSNETQGSGGMM
ncbi:outer membrane beta-barrel protein [Flavobacterium sp.]|uniref:outer membrane beta-barrel protein n=1 Tax=Flavobacterium sp. TaxID=239 RepID=UPI0038FC9440